MQTAKKKLAGRHGGVTMPSESDLAFYERLGWQWIGYGLHYGKDEPNVTPPIYLTLVYQVPEGHTRMKVTPRRDDDKQGGPPRLYDVYSV